MKIRDGFVSNSSSTSFLVAIPAHVSKENEPLIDIFEKVVDKLKSEKSYFRCGFVQVNNLIEDYDERINERIDEREHVVRFGDQISEFMKNKSYQKSVDLFLEIVEKSKGIDHLKYFTPKKHLFELKKETQEIIEEIEKDIEKLKMEKQQVIDNGHDSKYIISFTLDHWTSDIERVLEIMIEKGIVKLIRKVST